MKIHDLASIRERLSTVATWASLFILFAVALLALRHGDFDDPTQSNASPGNLLIASTPADRELLERMELRSRYAEAVLDGRLTLVQAAASCRELDRRSASFNLARFRRNAVGKSDEERYCQLIIIGVEGVLVSRQDHNSQIGKRLRGELAQHLRDGTLRLPPPAELED